MESEDIIADLGKKGDKTKGKGKQAVWVTKKKGVVVGGPNLA